MNLSDFTKKETAHSGLSNRRKDGVHECTDEELDAWMGI